MTISAVGRKGETRQRPMNDLQRLAPQMPDVIEFAGPVREEKPGRCPRQGSWPKEMTTGRLSLSGVGLLEENRRGLAGQGEDADGVAIEHHIRWAATLIQSPSGLS